MVFSRTANLHHTPSIKEALSQSSRPAPLRVTELPTLSQRCGPTPSSTPGPLRVTVHYHNGATNDTNTSSSRRVSTRYTRSYTDNVAATPCVVDTSTRRVRFELPPKSPAPLSSNAPGGKPAQHQPVAGVGSWLRSREYSQQSYSNVGSVSLSQITQPHKTPSPARIHDTARYRKGTLPPTAHGGPSLLGSVPGTSPAAAALLKAAQEGDEETMCQHLRRAARIGVSEADLNSGDSTGRTAVSHIASNGTLTMLEAILQLPGVDINKPDNEGNTPLHFAAQAGQVEAINFLLSRSMGIEVDARNNLGFTPLMKAALQGRTKCAKLLLFAGASPTLRDTGRGLRAEQWARFCGRYVCADIIEKFARHRLLERTTAYGRWGSEPELGAKLLLGGKLSGNPTHPSGFKSRLRKAFRTNSSGSGVDGSAARSQYSLVTQLTTAALCASSPVLPTPNVPPIVKSLIRPLFVPKVQVTSPDTTGPVDADPVTRKDRPPTARPSGARSTNSKKK